MPNPGAVRKGGGGGIWLGACLVIRHFNKNTMAGGDLGMCVWAGPEGAHRVNSREFALMSVALGKGAGG